MNKPVFLQGIATAVPPYEYTQSVSLEFMTKVQADSDKKRKFLERIYKNSSIEKRYSVIHDYGLPMEERTFFPKNQTLDPPPTTKERNDLFLVEGNKLSQQAVRKLLNSLPDLDPKTITHLVTVSCTGFTAPGFDFYLAKEIPLNPAVQRFHLGFMGCYAAFPAMRLAWNLCRADEKARVLIVNLELCSLHFQTAFEPDLVVANALFADGASASLVSCDPDLVKGPKFTIHEFSSLVIPGSETDMAWSIGNHGFDMRLSAYVPRFIEGNIQKSLDELFSKIPWKQEEIALWAIHPGGRAIVDNVKSVLKLTDGDLEPSYKTLRDYGNMSSATVFFVLKHILENPGKGKLFSASFGPGLTVESALLEKV